eukprot:CAMPEP_0194516776 /NCGR_PEP_ID=MMETSP0253-20130528/49766_1 /TAXON_ID=2966 /ORGANISM="Noctiluca scintillans" /LENGTH=143 /DNA_ID=CAMNT_0039360677 /DNA_START=14 /DNA_END=445 /DNA_ORIENTATION=+
MWRSCCETCSGPDDVTAPWESYNLQPLSLYQVGVFDLGTFAVVEARALGGETPAPKIDLPVLFELPDRSRRMVILSQRPLGICFSSQGPALLVLSVHRNSHADDIGIFPGWRVLNVDTEDVSQLGAAEAMEKLRCQTDTLPMM